jgi:hypothetical protein
LRTARRAVSITQLLLQLLGRGRPGALEGSGAVLPLDETRRIVAILAALGALAGCGGAATPATSGANAPSFLAATRPGAQFYGNDVVYTSQPSANDAAVYGRNGLYLTLLETLTSGLVGPEGTVATASRWWYLTNSGDSDVLVYRSTREGPTGPLQTLTDSGELPDNVSVTADRSLVAVSNATGTSSGAGSVSVYLNRSTHPSRVLTYGSDLVEGQGIAIDPQGNCYWSFDDLSNPSALGSIVEFAGCNGSGTLVKSGLTHAGGMVFDASGNLYYIDEASGISRLRTAPSSRPALACRPT